MTDRITTSQSAAVARARDPREPAVDAASDVGSGYIDAMIRTPNPRFDPDERTPVYGGREPDPRRLDDYGYGYDHHFHRTGRG